MSFTFSASAMPSGLLTNARRGVSEYSTPRSLGATFGLVPAAGFTLAWSEVPWTEAGRFEMRSVQSPCLKSRRTPRVTAARPG